jgi:DNA-binding LytR/AlgR family response regulator
METQPNTDNINSGSYALPSSGTGEIAAESDKADQLKKFFQHLRLPNLDDLLAKLATPAGKKSFLVFKNNKYINVLTEKIGFFYVNYESSVITCFDKQEYFVNHSLEQIQNLLPERQFFRINRQYLVNFNAIKEVEHYFARKLLVNLMIPAKDKLLVSKEKVRQFLNWLDDR